MNYQTKIQKILKNIQNVCQKIEMALQRSGRDKNSVSLIVVTKNQPKELIAELIIQSPGVIIAENRVLEAKTKNFYFDTFLAPQNDYHMHFIGRLQRNKVKDFLKVFNVIHSLDRWSLIEEIEKTAPLYGKKIKGFLQFNVSGEATKAGFYLDEMESLLPRLISIKNIDFVGLMTMAPINDEKRVRKSFYLLRKAREDFLSIYNSMQQKENLNFGNNFQIDSLSMGMSGDYIVAVEEGATHVRVGRAIFDDVS